MMKLYDRKGGSTGSMVMVEGGGEVCRKWRYVIDKDTMTLTKTVTNHWERVANQLTFFPEDVSGQGLVETMQSSVVVVNGREEDAQDVM